MRSAGRTRRATTHRPAPTGGVRHDARRSSPARSPAAGRRCRRERVPAHLVRRQPSRAARPQGRSARRPARSERSSPGRRDAPGATTAVVQHERAGGRDQRRRPAGRRAATEDRRARARDSDNRHKCERIDQLPAFKPRRCAVTTVAAGATAGEATASRVGRRRRRRCDFGVATWRERYERRGREEVGLGQFSSAPLASVITALALS